MKKLIIIVVGMLFILGFSIPASALPIANGSFEEPIVTAHGGDWEVFTSPIDGWAQDGGIELQTSSLFGPAADGNQYAELDVYSGGNNPWLVQTADAELQIIFPKAIAFLNDSKPPKKIAGKKLDLKLFEIRLPAATRLKTVTATPLKNNVAVDGKADGPIKNFKLFTIDNPARIVFDMYNLKSPYKKEQIIVVESKWVKRIRHFGHPDKVRLVLDTKKENLSKYSAHPTDTGLLIHVGKIPVVPNNASQIP